MFAAGKGAVNATSVTPTTDVGGITFITAGTYSLVVPANVYQVTAIAMGGGGGGGGILSTGTVAGAGGGGGALSYSNNVAVTPGETLTVVVGAAGAAGTPSSINGVAGGDSYIARGATNLLLAKGGSGGAGGASSGSGAGGGAGGSAASGVGDTKFSGGAGGGRNVGGGGGTAGYSGDGGTGGGSGVTAGAGGGGGGSRYVSGQASRGGGTLFYGEGTNGAAGVSSPSGFTYQSGGMGSALGGTAYFLGSSFTDRGPGGGGSGGDNTNGTDGSRGAVRILWGNSPIFPSTSVATNSVGLFASASSSSSTIIVPSNVLPGDTLVLVDFATSSGTPTSVTPSGFTVASNYSTSSSPYGRMIFSYKQVLSSAEAGSTITGMSSTTMKKVLLVFRGARGYCIASDVNVGGTAATTSAPSTRTASQATWDSYSFGIPIVIAGFYGSLGVSTSTDITFANASFVQGPDTTFWVGYRAYTQSTTSYSDAISMVDRGTNALCVSSVAGF